MATDTGHRDDASLAYEGGNTFKVSRKEAGIPANYHESLLD